MTPTPSDNQPQNLQSPPARIDGPVLIAGGGIGGLAAAVALAKRGIASHVLERRASYEPEGAGIQVGPNGTRILVELGLEERLSPLAGTPDFIHARDAESGTSLSRLPLGRWIAERHGAPYWVLHRRDLHEALLEAARAEASISIAQGFDVVTASNLPEQVTVEAYDGRRASGCALIIADGLRSRLRDMLFDGAPLRFARKSAARAVIAAEDMPDSLRENATGLWMSPRAHVVHYPVRAGREVALVFVCNDALASDDWNTIVPNSWVTETARAFAGPLRQLLDVPSVWKKWALYELPPLPYWSDGRVALLGDAAHPTLPFLAQGAVLALEDAAILARRLAEMPDNVPRALTAYASARRHRASRVVASAKTNGRIYHLDGFMAQARNSALKLTPPNVMMARYDWVYGWRPSA